MRIAVFGATGMAGSAVVTEARARGHHVVAASRNPGSTGSDHRLDVVALDVADAAAFDAVMSRVDAAVLTIRLAPGDEHRLAPLTRGVLDAAARHGTRVLVVGGAAPLRSPNHPDRLLIDDPDHVPEAWKQVAGASLEQFRACQSHDYHGWVYLSPPAVLEPADRAGGYRRGTTTLLVDEHGVSRIAAADLAIAVIDELENPGADRHFTVAHHATA